MDSPLVCIRKIDAPRPPVDSRHGVCTLCHQPVWIAHSSPHTDLIWCWECAGVEIAKSEKMGERITIARPTQEQLLDLAAHWNKA